jgi:hypothetical protein
VQQNLGAPATGNSGLQRMSEAAINMAIDPSTGVLSVTDYFQPWDYQNLEGSDADFGAGGVVLLDPGTFNGNGVSKMAVTAGKSGKVYVLNANNLGGYRMGAGQTDAVLQTILPPGSSGQAIFGAAGSYPGEGGYIYFCPVGKSLLFLQMIRRW